VYTVVRVLYRLRVVGRKNVPGEGGALLVCNHVTYADPAFLSMALRRPIRFIMARELYESRWMKPVCRLMGAIPISPHDAPRQVVKSLRKARACLDKGELVCIFPEGAMTRNGNLRGFRPGLERIVRGMQHKIVPACIGGAWGSYMSFYDGKPCARRPRRVPHPVSLVLGEPMDADSSSAAVRRRIQELSGRAFDLQKGPKRNLGRAFVRSARRRWSRPALSDTTGKHLSGGKALIAATMFARKIVDLAGDSTNVGIVLPPSVGAALANVGVVLAGKTPVNLNFTSSAESVDSAIRQCGIKTILSSRKFIEKYGKFEPPEGTVFLEDVIASVSGRDRIAALLKAIFLPAGLLLQGREPGPDDTATIIFSSGSTGEPKGVVLTHHNVLSNLEAVQMVFRFTHDDRMCAVLPFFHSFGFTCTLWVPLLQGFLAYYHSNPMDATKIAEMVRENGLTVLLATPTFLLGYMRRAQREDFATLRCAIAGAEKLQTRIADAFEAQFGLRPLEGYGTTELSPVVSLNVPHVEAPRVGQIGTKEGSVGHPLPGIAARTVDVATRVVLAQDVEGMLEIKGPNVMQGYLGKPEKTAEVLREGWYETGDIARIDEDGFIFILDRLSRFSKIGGEMVPHIAIEEALASELDTMQRAVAVTAAADERKGEQLVVFHTDEAGDADRLSAALERREVPNLWRPRRANYVRVEALPVLGSGKLDLKKLRSMAQEFVELRPGAVQQAIDKVRRAL